MTATNTTDVAFNITSAAESVSGNRAHKTYVGSPSTEGLIEPATATKQPALGTAGASSADVITVQGAAGGVAQPVSAASLPLPSGAATATNQPTAAAQGSTTSGQTGVLVQGAVTTANPVYTAGQTAPISLATDGTLRTTPAGGGGGGTSSNFAAAFPTMGTAIGAKNGANMVNLAAGALGELNVTPWIAGALNSVTNGIFTNLLQGNAALSATNPIFISPATGVKVASTVADGDNITFGATTDGVWSGSGASTIHQLLRYLADQAALAAKIVGNAGGVLDAVDGATAPANALLTGGKNSSGNIKSFQTTLTGTQIVYPWSVPEGTWQGAAPAGGIVNSTAGNTMKAAGAAGIRTYLKNIQIGVAGTVAAASELVIRDGAGGTVLWRGNLPAAVTGTSNIIFEPPLRGSAATLMEVATLTAMGASSAVYINAQGYQAA